MLDYSLIAGLKYLKYFMKNVVTPNLPKSQNFSVIQELWSLNSTHSVLASFLMSKKVKV